MNNSLHFVLLAVFMTTHWSICETGNDPTTHEDPVDRILRERGLKQPHEMKVRKRREDRQEKESCSAEKPHVGKLKADLQQCIEENESLKQKHIQASVQDSLKKNILDTPYMKQIYRLLLQITKPLDHSSIFLKGISFKINNDSIIKIEKCLNDEFDVQYCTDILLDFIRTGTFDKPSQLMASFFDMAMKVNFTYLAYGTIFVIVSYMVMYIAIKLISSSRSFGSITILVLYLVFLASVPWEWMRLYKEALAKKTYEQISAPKECIQDKFSYLSLFKFWLQDSFSFADNTCLKYYAAVITEPLWEVTPGQAVSAAVSRIFLHPMLVCCEYMGKCLRLIFREVPVQWQPIVLVALLLIILLGIGVQVRTPLLQIGRGGQDMRGQLKAKDEKINNLMLQINYLNERLQIKDQDGRDVVENVGKQDIANQAVDESNMKFSGHVIVPPDQGNVCQHTAPIIALESGTDDNASKVPIDHDDSADVGDNAKHRIFEIRSDFANAEHGVLQETK